MERDFDTKLTALTVKPNTKDLFPKGMPPTKYVKTKWSEINWSQPSHKIAAKIGCSKDLVYAHRKKYAPNTIREKTQQTKIYNVKWEDINWNRTNKELSKEIGCHQSPSYLEKKEH